MYHKTEIQGNLFFLSKELKSWEQNNFVTVSQTDHQKPPPELE